MPNRVTVDPLKGGSAKDPQVLPYPYQVDGVIGHIPTDQQSHVPHPFQGAAIEFYIRTIGLLTGTEPGQYGQ
jgi:hypothetical protein